MRGQTKTRRLVLSWLLTLAAAPLLSAEEAADKENEALENDRLRQIVAMPLLYEVSGMDAVEIERDIRYLEDDGAGVTLDVYRPAGLAAGERRGGVVFLHGGPVPPAGGVPSPKSWGIFTSYGRLMAASGLVGVTVDHRYHSLETLERSMDDVAAAIRHLRVHAGAYHLDPDRLCLWVFSGAGVHLSLPFAERPEHVRCLVAFYSVLDFAPFSAMGLGTAPPEIAGRYRPADHLAAGNGFPPLLIARAGGDHPTTNESIDEFLSAALKSGVPIELMNHPAGQHGFDILNDDERTREIIERAVAFVTGHLEERSAER